MEEYTVKVFNDKTEWYQNGKYHRVNGPAIEYSNGDKHYYQNGKLHREDGPAVELNNGGKFYYQNGKQHREDGPAVIYSNGITTHWLNGVFIPKEKFVNKQNSDSLDGKVITVDGKEFKLIEV